MGSQVSLALGYFHHDWVNVNIDKDVWAWGHRCHWHCWHHLYQVG